LFFQTSCMNCSRALMGIVEFLAIYLSFNDKYTATQATSFMIDLVMNGVRKT